MLGCCVSSPVPPPLKLIQLWRVAFCPLHPKELGSTEGPYGTHRLQVDNDMKFPGNVPGLGEFDSLETAFLLLGHLMFDHLPWVMVPMTKEMILCEKYQLHEAFDARGMKWMVQKPTDQSNGYAHVIPIFKEHVPESKTEHLSNMDSKSLKSG